MTFLRQWHDKFLRKGNITQTVVITTYCNKHKVPSGMILNVQEQQADNYVAGIRFRVNEHLIFKSNLKRAWCVCK